MAISFFEKMVFDLILFLVAVKIFKKLTNNRETQEKIKMLPAGRCLAPLLQWYTILIIGVMIVGIDITINIVQSDYYEKDWLNPSLINASFEEHGLNNSSSAERIGLELPDWLRRFSMTGPFAAFFAFWICVAHFIAQARANAIGKLENKKIELKEIAEQEKSQIESVPREFNAWWFNEPQDCLALIIILPAIFILMSARSLSRMWMIFTGVHVGADRITDIALFDENFELCYVCQYIVVFAFVRLSFYVMKFHSQNRDIRIAMKMVGFQGVYGWIIVGSIHSAMLFFCSYFGHHAQEGSSMLNFVNKLKEVEPKVALVQTVFSLLATYNMVIVCKLPLLERDLGNANLKFLATKMMVLVAPIQLKLITVLSGHSATSSLESQVANKLNLSIERAMLLHATLMCWESLIAVLLNFATWKDVLDDCWDKSVLDQLLTEKDSVREKETEKKKLLKELQIIEDFLLQEDGGHQKGSHADLFFGRQVDAKNDIEVSCFDLFSKKGMVESDPSANKADKDKDYHLLSNE